MIEVYTYSTHKMYTFINILQVNSVRRRCFGVPRSVRMGVSVSPPRLAAMGVNASLLFMGKLVNPAAETTTAYSNPALTREYVPEPVPAPTHWTTRASVLMATWVQTVVNTFRVRVGPTPAPTVQIVMQCSTATCVPVGVPGRGPTAVSATRQHVTHHLVLTMARVANTTNQSTGMSATARARTTSISEGIVNICRHVTRLHVWTEAAAFRRPMGTTIVTASPASRNQTA